MTRRPSVPAVTILAAAACLVAAPAAGAATIHACVKPKSGATRIVSAKARCRHGEKKLSWSTTGPQGPAGPAGAPGAAGTPGASGTGPAFVAGASETALTEVPSLLFTKTIPPGDYVLVAPVLLSGHTATAEKLIDVGCFIVDKSGTSLTNSDLTGKSTQLAGLGSWESPLAKESASEFRATDTMTLAGALESKATNTVGVACDDVDTSPGVTAAVIFSELVATQVSSITS